MAANRIKIAVVLGVSMLALTACESARQSLGLDRVPPDEFNVVTRAPLTVPPGVDLQPPRPGAPRPQEPTTRDRASDVLFQGGVSTASPSAANTASAGLGLGSGLGLGGFGLGGSSSGMTPGLNPPPAQAQAPTAIGPSAGEQALLSMVGADRIDPSIRAQVDAETSARISADTRFIDRLLSLDVPQGALLDASAEADRIRRNQALGLPLTQGEVPRIERRGRAMFEGVF